MKREACENCRHMLLVDKQHNPYQPICMVDPPIWVEGQWRQPETDEWRKCSRHEWKQEKKDG